MTFGSRLRTARKAKQLTQKELAAKINAAHNSISNWENDQNMPDPDTIQNLCWVLEVQPNYFFEIDQDPSPKTQSDRNTIRIAGRNGSFVERQLTDQQLSALLAILDQLPDASDDL
jgi:transcriptional regulator with XRE-family HTH domain